VVQSPAPAFHPRIPQSSGVRTAVAGGRVVHITHASIKSGQAHNAEQTIERTWQEVIAQEVVDLVIVVDDHSRDATVARARGLPKVVVREHAKNVGYGGNQKTCYHLALEHDADILVMVHPDYQYTPKLIPAMAGLVASGLYQCVLGSRILGGGAIRGGERRSGATSPTVPSRQRATFYSEASRPNFTPDTGPSRASS
jgi:glycosyltransferase involved in cell wall biosynthesis